MTAVLALAACGDDGVGGASQEPAGRAPQATAAPDPSQPDAEAGRQADAGADTGADTGADEATLAVLLPDEADAPAGFRRLGARCAGGGSEGAWFTYVVPDDWTPSAQSTAGSGSPRDGVTHTYRTEIGPVSVDMKNDIFDNEGRVMTGPGGGPFESFDYDRNDDLRIVFDEVATLTVGDQDVDIFVAEQSQAPESLSTTQHTGRVQTYLLTVRGRLQPSSMVVSITHDAERGDLAADTVTTIVESIAVPPCTVEHLVTQYEALAQVDLDGDGKIRTSDDLRELETAFKEQYGS